MGISLRIRAESGLLTVTATGEFSLGEGERTFLEILDAVAQHRTKKILFDGQELQGEPHQIERFYYGRFAAEAVADFRKLGVIGTPQFAYVLREPVLDPGRFGETVARNRGMWVKAFDNLEEALNWLRPDPAATNRMAAKPERKTDLHRQQKT